MPETNPPRLLIKMPPEGRRLMESQPLRLAGTAFQLRLLCPNEEIGRMEAAPGLRWYLAEAGPGALTTAELWEEAHNAVTAKGSPLATAGVYIEPDLLHPWPYDNPARGKGLGAAPGDTCVYNDQAADLPQGPGFAWHLGQNYAELKQARDQVATSPAPVRLAIMDVGFDFSHGAVPKPPQLLTDLQRNFVQDGQPDNDASDPFSRGLFKNPGHGTATIAILAGGRLNGMIPPEADTGDYLGGAPLAEVIPVRIASSVILLYTSAFVEGLDYLIAPNGDPSLRPDVVSMSMGGLASRAWADVVNRAYEAGICLVTAAGNNFPGSPQSIVYPARFKRVIAACGVMADGRPYIRREVPLLRMAGNFGPDSKMDTAMAAFTPNITWAEINCPTIIDMDGAGTSAATPQIAAAAALWLQKYKGQLQGRNPWEVVETIRQALFTSAKKGDGNAHTYFGQGILKAAAALAVQPAAQVTKTPADEVSFPILRVLTGVGVTAAPGTEMLEVEALQLLQRDPAIEKTIKDPDRPELTSKEIKDFLEAAIASELASATLKNHLKAIYKEKKFGSLPWAQEGAKSPPPITGGKVRTPVPVGRLLRGYAFDPELSTHLETSQINEVVFQVPWEEDLKPGPSGEYMEVIDHDPSTGCFYAPVDLNDKSLLANNGLPPTEGDPKFHQQMVYAVAMCTINNFEIALGRKALWSPQMVGEDDRRYVQKLRIYPHALRERNAYYDPEKKALLFGYFPATAADPGNQYPGGMVFTCLSHDIVAHETTHALLDGMYRKFIEPSNDDQLAFHEAFADIVALFQHFSMPEVLQHQIAKTRGDIRAENLLGELAQQFGLASGLHGALRSYVGRKDTKTGKPMPPDPSLYAKEMEPHARGALLVAAVFDAFLSIYENRTADLFRLATSGTGVLPAGAIHPDLVKRLSEEAAMASQHVLNMCIRALDYCPPVDLTFGDYLRALITADYDLVPDDRHGYRVAFVDAFRRWGIYPQDLRTLSVEALRWRPAWEDLEDEDKEKDPLRHILHNLRKCAEGFMSLRSRKEIFHYSRDWRKKVHEELKHLFQVTAKDYRKQQKLMSALGLDLTTGSEHFEVHTLRVSDRQGPDLMPRPPKVLLSLVQKRLVQPEPSEHGLPFWFKGGCTIIADPREAAVDYYVSKNILSKGRQARHQAFNASSNRPLADVYFSSSPLTGMAQRLAMLHAD